MLSFREALFSEIEVKQPDPRRLMDAEGERRRGERLVSDLGVGDPAIDEFSEMSSVPRKLPYLAELIVRRGRSVVEMFVGWVI